ncbi:hypothetical protein [Petrachloros mirabilis]
MFEKHPRYLVMLSLLSGLVGGVLATFFLAGTSVVAQPTSADTPKTMNADIPKTVSAQEFRLVDTQGRARALLAFTENGQPFLQLRDEFDTYRVWMGISNDTGVAVRDVDGKTRLLLSVDEQGEPSLVVRDRQHRTKSFHP